MEAQFKADINWLHEEIDKIKDPKFLSIVKNLFEYRQQKSKTFISDDDIREEGCTIEEYNDELDEVLEEVKKGHFVSHEDVKKESKLWLKKE